MTPEKKEMYLEWILRTLGTSTMTTTEIADFIGRKRQTVYEVLCYAKDSNLVELVWVDRYTPAWKVAA